MAWVRVLGVLLVCTAACAHAPPPAAPRPPPPPRLPEAKPRAPRPPPPAEWYWQPVTADVHAPPRKPLALPVAEAAIVKSDAGWAALPPEAKEKLRAAGEVVLGSETDPMPRSATSFGAFYADIAEVQKTPELVTVDALFGVTRLGLELALAQAEEPLAAALEALVTRLEARLGAEQKGANATLSEAYRVARGIVAVAGTGKPPSDLAAAVAAERALVEAHAVTAVSPVLGFPIDYTRFAVPSAAGRPAVYRSLAWLGSAPLPLVARAEHAGAPLDVAQARTATRAAMLLARLCDADVDAETNALYTRLSRFLAFAWGPSDDLTLPEIDDIGTKAGVDLTKPEHIVDVAKVDKIRFGAMKARAPGIYDGPGGVGRSVRMFGGHASPDALALTALLGAKVGAAQDGAPPALQRNGARVVPSTLDIAAWFGAAGAKTALHETHADAFADFDAALTKLTETRDLDAYHASIYESFLVAAGALASEAEPAAPSRLESILAAWSMVRHVDAPFARPKPKPAPSSARGAPAESAVPILVENAPEAVARLLGTVRQTKRGLEALGLLAPASPVLALDELLTIALTAAEHRANDEPLAAADLAKVATLPARIAAIEEDSGDAPAIAAVVAGDPPSRRVLVTATGRIEPIYELTRDIGREEPLLVVGAHLAHHELVTDPGEAPTDAAWRGKLRSASRAAYTAAFRVVPAGRISP